MRKGNLASLQEYFDWDEDNEDIDNDQNLSLEVTYDVFIKWWSRILHEQGKDHNRALDVSLVWTEIRSYITGSFVALQQQVSVYQLVLYMLMNLRC